MALGAGTFTGPGNREITDCQSAGRGFYLGTTPARTRLEGFTIKGGEAERRAILHVSLARIIGTS
jgi:hypothetical protein